MKYLKSDIDLGKVIPNIALMLERNAVRFADKNVFCKKKNGKYEGITWKNFFRDIQNIASNLMQCGFQKGDKIVIYSPNSLEMLELELAVMTSGGIAVPIFAYFHKETAELLIKHSDAEFLAVAGELQLSRIPGQPIPNLSQKEWNLNSLKKIFVFDDINLTKFKNNFPCELISFNGLLEKQNTALHSSLPSGGTGGGHLNFDAGEKEICLNMYTSGTMGVPKCVQLSHGNILSQQAGLEKIWKLDENDRFLSYLPWHHSFGGIFELFAALYNGTTIYLESSYGKDANEIFDNWKLVQPTVFFSVPKVFQSLVDLTKSNSKAEELFFHSGLKFIFTAAAPLPKNLSDEFEKRNIPVMEGWGLTETSPCCTITDPKQKRGNGVVGKPIPGVEIRIANDGEIQVKGPNVMKGYYKNNEANKNIFTPDGWYCTGDVGEIVPSGLKLLSRKDRIFKLTNGEKVIPAEMEALIQHKCHYVTYAIVIGGGKEYPVALLFPNKKAIEHPNYELSPEEGCFCPRTLGELRKCLHGCLHDANCGLNQKFSKIKYAMIIDDELNIESSTLTPSMKIAPNKVIEAYKAHIENLYGAKNKLSEEVYIIKLDTENSVARKELV